MLRIDFGRQRAAVGSDQRHGHCPGALSCLHSVAVFLNEMVAREQEPLGYSQRLKDVKIAVFQESIQAADTGLSSSLCLVSA